MSTIAFIPARCGSKSIRFKNIKPLCNKPLIYWAISALQRSESIDKIVVATDCDEIMEVVEGLDKDRLQVYKRESVNAQDSSSTESVMLEYINKEHLDRNTTFILVQATSPFTQPEDFDRALQKYKTGHFDSMLSCVRIKRFFWDENGTPVNYDYRNRPRRQDFSGQLVENGAFYINSVGNIIDYENRLSGKIGIFEMPEYTFIELDEEADWLIAERLMETYVLKDRTTATGIKLFLTDVDGVLTDAGMYYSENGDELKKFNTKDGMGFKLLKEKDILTGIITSENRELNQRRAIKLKLDFIFQGISNKLETAKKLCKELNIELENVAYIGDDINDLELLSSVGLAACPNDANEKIKRVHGIKILKSRGGEGAVREFVEMHISG